jgi:hypothetical protein
MVGVGFGASLEGENQIWREKRILLYIQTKIELVDILSSEMETPNLFQNFNQKPIENDA